MVPTEQGVYTIKLNMNIHVNTLYILNILQLLAYTMKLAKTPKTYNIGNNN